MEKETIRIFFILSLSLSFIGGILLLATDFGGYYYYIWGCCYFWVYIGLGSSVIGAILIVLAVNMLFFCTFASLCGMLENEGIKFVDLDQKKLLNIGLICCYIVLTLCILGAIALGVTAAVIEAETTSSWVDVGFYGGLIGSGATAFFIKFYLVKSENNN